MTDERIIQRALDLLAARLHAGEVLSSPAVVHDYLRLHLGAREHEVFVVILLVTMAYLRVADPAHGVRG